MTSYADLPISLVFLSGGIGSRMGSSLPKQYLLLQNKPIALHSFEVFLSIKEFDDYVVVCNPEWESLFSEIALKIRPEKKLRFARPGKLRQDSVWNGLLQLSGEVLVCIHDGARPLISETMVHKVLQEAKKVGAAALGVRVKSTIKQCNKNQLVIATLDRSSLFDIQTPQVILLSWLKEGFAYARAHQIEVTDDLSLIELIQKPAKIVEGSYSNVKITTPEDLKIVEYLRCSVTN